MKGKREEAEVIIRLDQMEECAYICVSAWPAMYRKMTRRYGPGLDSKGNSCRWKVPIRAISFRGPEKKARKATGRAFAGLKRQLDRSSGFRTGEIGGYGHPND